MGPDPEPHFVLGQHDDKSTFSSMSQQQNNINLSQETCSDLSEISSLVYSSPEYLNRRGRVRTPSRRSNSPTPERRGSPSGARWRSRSPRSGGR